MASKRNGTLYIGVTNDLARRAYEHREGMVSGFTKKYSVKQLVYYQVFDEVLVAIQREKQLKEWQRKWKIDLIETHNPGWTDLYTTLQL